MPHVKAQLPSGHPRRGHWNANRAAPHAANLLFLGDKRDVLQYGQKYYPPCRTRHHHRHCGKSENPLSTLHAGALPALDVAA